MFSFAFRKNLIRSPHAYEPETKSLPVFSSMDSLNVVTLSHDPFSQVLHSPMLHCGGQETDFSLPLCWRSVGWLLVRSQNAASRRFLIEFRCKKFARRENDKSPKQFMMPCTIRHETKHQCCTIHEELDNLLDQHSAFGLSCDAIFVIVSVRSPWWMEIVWSAEPSEVDARSGEFSRSRRWGIGILLTFTLCDHRNGSRREIY